MAIWVFCQTIENNFNSLTLIFKNKKAFQDIIVEEAQYYSTF